MVGVGRWGLSGNKTKTRRQMSHAEIQAQVHSLSYIHPEAKSPTIFCPPVAHNATACHPVQNVHLPSVCLPCPASASMSAKQNKNARRRPRCAANRARYTLCHVASKVQTPPPRHNVSSSRLSSSSTCKTCCHCRPMPMSKPSAKMRTCKVTNVQNAMPVMPSPM